MKALSGHMSPKSGDILWNGQSISKQASYDRAKSGIAYVPQGRDIFSQQDSLSRDTVGAMIRE